MDAAERAKDILASWERRDLTGLQAALSRTLGPPVEPGVISTEEQERMELLGGIVSQMRCEIRQMPVLADPGEGAQVCFRLLRHLAASGQSPAVRSENLYFLPYRRPARRAFASR